MRQVKQLVFTIALVITTLMLTNPVFGESLDTQIKNLESAYEKYDKEIQTVKNAQDTMRNHETDLAQQNRILDEKIRNQTLDVAKSHSILTDFLSKEQWSKLDDMVNVKEFRLSTSRRDVFNHTYAQYLLGSQTIKELYQFGLEIQYQQNQVSKELARLSTKEKELIDNQNSLKQQVYSVKQKKEKLSVSGYAAPLEGVRVISSSFGYREDPVGYLGNDHQGIDFIGNYGETVLAARDGIVVEAQYGSAQGNCVILLHEDGLYTYYMHLSDMMVSVGQEVEVGQTVGEMGSTGASTGVHLHFGVSHSLWNDYVDPQAYLP